MPSDSAGDDVLVIGYGNPGRQDDGLGPAAVEALRPLGLPGVAFDADYQLTVEDAAAVAEHETVVFVDADLAGPEPFWFRAVEPKAELGFSSHGCEPPAVMALAKELFGAATKGYVLGIRGYEFGEIAEGLSARAQANLEDACEFLAGVLAGREFDNACRQFRNGPAGGAKGNGLCKTGNT